MAEPGLGDEVDVDFPALSGTHPASRAVDGVLDAAASHTDTWKLPL